MKNFGFGLVGDRLEVVPDSGGAMPISVGHARIGGADRQRDPRAERHAAGPERRAPVALLHEVERRPEVVHLAGAVGERAGASSRAAEVEAQHGAADAGERLRGLIDDLRVHRAAVLGVRMREDDRRSKTGRRRRGRLVEQRFQAARPDRAISRSIVLSVPGNQAQPR